PTTPTWGWGRPGASPLRVRRAPAAERERKERRQMEVARLYYGSIDGFIGDATPFNGYAIKHPQGVVLVDTGFGPIWGEGPIGHLHGVNNASYPWVRRTTIDALADHELDPSDVKFIINTHLGDHSGDNVMFKHATFIIQQPEAEHSRKNHPQNY